MSLVTVTWAWAKEGNSFASAGHMSQLMSSNSTAKERQPRADTCQQGMCTNNSRFHMVEGENPGKSPYNLDLSTHRGYW